MLALDALKKSNDAEESLPVQEMLETIRNRIGDLKRMFYDQKRVQSLYFLTLQNREETPTIPISPPKKM